MIKKIYNLKFAIRNCNKGMTYVELIVVLSIFAVLTSVVMFNYRDFQARVETKNLASDIALKIVEAQKSSVNGLLPLSGAPFSEWKPSYGIFFNLAFNSRFIYFNDLNSDGAYDEVECPGTECINLTTITKGNFIEKIESYIGSTPTTISTLSISFIRPDSTAIFNSNGSPLTGADYVKITVKSPRGDTAAIKVYPSGRIQVN